MSVLAELPLAINSFFLDVLCVHDSYFGERHKTISVAIYESSQFPHTVRCKKHNEKIILACEKCHELVCAECDLSAACSATRQLQHKFSSLNKHNEEIKTHFERLLKSASDKLTEICRLNKQAWLTLDECEAQGRASLKLIDKICQESMQNMWECDDKLLKAKKNEQLIAAKRDPRLDSLSKTAQM
ncbi:uncharacterized protein [Watersipora subatra]|uniref:uncharacterized protein n=1 Tax=Watersipora subatra TaxID=2589382 RepID=UPI00355C9555